MGNYMLVSPHGSVGLKPLLLPPSEAEEARRRASSFGHKIEMTSRELSDLLMLGMGAYTPLDGFMGYRDWQGVCEEMKTGTGLFWPIPITLSVSEEAANNIKIGDEVALTDNLGRVCGQVTAQEIYQIDKAIECNAVFGTVDTNHPGVAKVMDQHPYNLSGPVKVFDEGDYPKKYKGLYMKPAETRVLFEKNGWSSVAAFQTRNPMHRSHEHLAKIAIEICDGLLIHQVLGALKPGDIPAEVRVDAIDALVKNYFVPGTAIQAGYPIEMRYAGPREALLHAVFRQNFGCSHLVVGRDHAGVGDYYGPFDAHKIFDEIPRGSMETQPLKIDIAFYSYKCGGMATGRTCPSEQNERLNISGTRLREMFANKETIPAEFSRPEVVAVLQRYYDNLSQVG
uniref:Sulfate adenylyltransferase n=1 Tax=uncultured alpha proteobacterium EBAC2C11 TaxID=295349 RepID=Q5UEX8_9PROT|nr:predicted sulfate adenylyltransferase [uncultured alpha proteobacterium EBAC2C11]